ncbi:hypothetical protein GCM10025781_00990 [Kocuria gwangalliensis]|uniref:DUF4244 domain-containing protein n=2 Tax=Micrococcaceae TaxID=1268 RepID=A0ABP8WEM0_9MICC
MIRDRAPPGAGDHTFVQPPPHTFESQENPMSTNIAATSTPAAPTTIAPDAVLEPPGTDLALGADHPDLGASTAEYAVIVLAAAAFGGVMAAVLSSDSVSGLLLGIIQKALSV